VRFFADEYHREEFLTALGVIVTAPRAVAIGYGVALLLYLGAT